MPIPPLNEKGLLPPGEHVCTLDEARERFGSFQGNDHRRRLFSRLEQLVNELRRSGLFSALVVDGSFATAKSAPEDIDVIVAMRRGHDWAADLSPDDYALVSRSVIRRRFGFDVFLAGDGDTAYGSYVEFFSRVRENATVRKGMLRIEL